MHENNSSDNEKHIEELKIMFSLTETVLVLVLLLTMC